MHACSLHRGNHSPWSPLNCQKTDTAPEVTHWRSIGSICRHAGLKLVKRRPVHHHLRPYLQSWTLAAQSLPYLQASRRRNALRDTSRGRVRAQGLRKPHSPGASNIQDHRAQQQRQRKLYKVLCHSRCTASIGINSAKSDALSL
jgi:hypothetical protein